MPSTAYFDQKIKLKSASGNDHTSNQVDNASKQHTSCCIAQISRFINLGYLVAKIHNIFRPAKTVDAKSDVFPDFPLWYNTHANWSILIKSLMLCHLTFLTQKEF